MCPYDIQALPDAVLQEAERNHPSVLEDGTRRVTSIYRDLSELTMPFDHPLPEPPVRPVEFAFDHRGLAETRHFVARYAEAQGLSTSRASDLVLAVNEIATNSLRHGDGYGVLRVWVADDEVVCEIRDRGHIDDPLAGRTAPEDLPESGIGLWLANQLCELVQVRSFETGSVVRLHVSMS